MVLTRERRGHVEILTMNRPDARNAINVELATALSQAFGELADNDGVRAVVLTGNGPVFCAGADLREMAAGRGMELASVPGGFAGLVQREFPKPLIAAVNGPALAGGFEIVLACDLVVASTDARFGIPEVKRGLFAGAGGLIRLPARVPRAIAVELAITGDPIDADRARALGLVNRVVPTAAVLDEALALAGVIEANGPLAVQKSLEMVRAAGDLTEAEAWPLNNRLAAQVGRSADAIEGATAFIEKRAPNWTGA
ncbi:MAG: crotonase/enoyl-CoA hydratase family protein [Acidimicrobiia bacterium]